MLARFEKLLQSLLSGDLGDWRGLVEEFVDVLKDAADVPEADRHELTEKASASGVRWEFKRALAMESHRLPSVLAAHLLARLSQDPNPYVRQAAKRAARRRDQTVDSEETPWSRPPAVDDIIAKISRVGGTEAAQLAGEASDTARSYALAEVAHELKNIAQMILTPMRGIDRDLDPEAKQKAGTSLKKLRSGVRALTEFSKNLQFLAEGKDLRFARTDAHAVVSDAIALLFAEQQRRVRVPAASPVFLAAVHERLARALGNIVRNGLESSLPDGVVVVEVFFPDEDEVGFRVTDRGPGVPVDQRTGVFRLGATTKRELGPGHQGMGLYLAAQVIRVEHGGTIDISTGPEGGAVFDIRVPIRPSRR